MPFLIFSNANIKFALIELTWRSYTIVKALPTIKQVKIINKKESIKAALDENVEAFVIYITSFNLK